MRIMPIRVFTGSSGARQMKASFQKNWKHYLQEALGLAIFMMSACFFGALLEAKNSPVRMALSDSFTRTAIMGVLMGLTALFIFYSPLTSASGSHINPAVTLSFLRMDKMCRYDAFFFVIAQVSGGTMAVYIMQWLMGGILTEAPVNTVVTIPGKMGKWIAFATEFIIAFVTMTMVLFTSHNSLVKKYTRVLSAFLVCTWVIVAGPISGFGMNPARSFASALPSGIWTDFWIYVSAPVAGMLGAAEFFIYYSNYKGNIKSNDKEKN
jgi:aquaporin Z